MPQTAMTCPVLIPSPNSAQQGQPLPPPKIVIKPVPIFYDQPAVQPRPAQVQPWRSLPPAKPLCHSFIFDFDGTIYDSKNQQWIAHAFDLLKLLNNNGIEVSVIYSPFIENQDSTETDYAISEHWFEFQRLCATRNIVLASFEPTPNEMLCQLLALAINKARNKAKVPFSSIAFCSQRLNLFIHAWQKTQNQIKTFWREYPNAHLTQHHQQYLTRRYTNPLNLLFPP